MSRLLGRCRPVLVVVAGLLLAAFDSPDVRSQPKGKGLSKAGKKSDLKKYDEVITKDAKSTPGVFLVHRIDDKLFFEVPQDALGKPMLWTIEVAKAPHGLGWGGKSAGNRVVRFDRRGNRVYLWTLSFEKRADGTAIQRAVDSANADTIIASFPVEAEGKDRSAVIDTTALFVTDQPDFSVRRAITGAGTIDSDRSYLDSVKAFPTNIEIRALLTFRGGAGGLPGPLDRTRGPVAGGGGRSSTALLHHSLVMLPEKPMMGRYFDPRVGYFTRRFEDYAGKAMGMERKQYIARFRLEKKNPAEEVSEPVKPIVFYLSREVPEKWRSYLKKGVEDWAPAFEKAGFKNAIICKDAPSENEDPGWDAEDARHSVIRWVSEPVANAMGPHVHDPRSGEIISAHIIFWHDITKLVQQWYFIQCGATDPRVKTLPLPEEITGELLRYVSCHEVGHTLGLRHNHRASQAYTVAQLRDPAFCAKNGTVASIMSYGRFNYVAQPEDKVKDFVPKLGPYDNFAIEWGYKPIAAKSPAAERKTLDTWAARQIKEPHLRFGGEDGPSMVDPTVLTENIADDAIEATKLGLKNLDRVLDKLVAATTKTGEDYTLLQDTYRAALQHRAGWLSAVSKQVGGVVEQRTLAGRGEETFTRVPRERQQKAVQFLLENAFVTPKKLVAPAIVSKFKYAGVADDVTNQQRMLLVSLLSGRRFRQLMDAEVLDEEKSYSAVQFLSDVQEGVWSELKSSQTAIDPLRRALQRNYLEHLKNEMASRDAGPFLGGRRGPDDDDFAALMAGSRGTDFRAVARAALETLAEQIDNALPRAKNAMTRAHLKDARKQVQKILDAKE